jgi:hypothetical protein
MHKKSNHKRHQSNTRKIRKGGEYLGKGAYGIVYGNPRLPCKNETHEEVEKKNEVSKIFRTELDATNEWTSIENLQTLMKTTLDYDNLQNHAIIPSRLCEINLNEVNRKNSIFENKDWMMDRSGKVNDNIFNFNVLFRLDKDIINGTIIRFPSQYKKTYDIKYKNDNIIKKVPISNIISLSIHTLPDDYRYKHMIISDRGENSLYNVFLNIKGDTHRFKVAVQKMLSILKGIQILQNNNFIHGDIKSGNCIEHETTYKLIDMADVIHIPLIENVDPKPFAFGYSIWPSIIIYSIFFDNEHQINNNINIELTPKDLRQLYKKGDNNDNDYQYYLHSSIIAPFLINDNHGFTDQEIDKIFTMCGRLVSQKTCGIINIDIKKINDPDYMWNDDIFKMMQANIYNPITYDETKKSESDLADLENYKKKYLRDSGLFLDKFNNVFKNMENESNLTQNVVDINENDIVVFKNGEDTYRGRISSKGKDNTYSIDYYPKVPKSSKQLNAALKYGSSLSKVVPGIISKQIIQKINRDELKLDLFKRIDIYSFGIMVLEVIYNYINENNEKIDESLRTMIMELYDFVEKCCIQTERCADINTLVTEYESIIDKLVSPKESNTRKTTTQNNKHMRNNRNPYDNNYVPNIDDVKHLLFPKI